MTTVKQMPVHDAEVQHLDPLLTAARVLLWVFLAGVVIALIMSVFGLTSYVAAMGSALLVPVWHAAWEPVSRLLFGSGALWISGDIARTVLAMIDAVAKGEAFAKENAGRMESIASHVIGLQVLGFVAAWVGVDISGDVNGYEIGFDLSPAGVAFALLLFILARVFRQGAELRHDLAGTI